MCGIIGVLSRDDGSVVKVLMNGLHELQNRGYDSIGFSMLDKTFIIHKDVCDHNQDDIQRLFSVLDQDMGSVFHNGIAHSRWATHGGITKQNAHPHICFRGLFTVVHNGIIENCKELKEQLLREHADLVFLSGTDTEVIVNMISSVFCLHYTQPSPKTLSERIAHAIGSVAHQLQGTYGLVIQCRLTPHHIYCLRYGSPLVVGVAPQYVVVVSEKSALPPNVDAYFPMEDHDLVILCDDPDRPVSRVREDTIVFIQNKPQPHDDKQGYSSWTEKEIMEQPDAIERCIKNGSRILPNNNGVQLGGLLENKEKIDQTDHLILLGCGTSHHACLLTAHYFRTMNNRIQTVQVCDGSEFHTSIIAKVGRTSLIVVSQSGETMDLLLAIHRFREYFSDGLVLGIINVVDSVIARTVDGGVYTNSGKERGVASTKSFTTQIVALYLTSCFFSSPPYRLDMIRGLSDAFRNNSHQYRADVKKMCPFVMSFHNLFIIGKSFDYFIAMEASLKIKEICYIHAEAYSSSSLKHGPFALLDEQMLVILLSNSPNDRFKLENAYQEISARRAPILVISYENINHCPYYIHIPWHPFSYLEANMVLQMLALELSISKGINPDYPKNLAKVVTVE